MRVPGGVLGRDHLHVRRAGIVAVQAIVQPLGVHARGQQAQLQRHRQHDALAECAVGGHEDRPLRQARVLFDFRRVLVRQAQPIELERRPLRPVRPFVGVHAGAAAARVAGHGVHRHRVIGRHQACLDQRPQEGDGASGVAARVAHAPGLRDQPALLRVHFGKAVDPARIRAMRRTGVDHADRRVDDGGRRLARGLVGQAQDGDVAGVDRLGAALRVLALRLGQRQQPQVGAAVQALMDLQAGGALVAVDENKGMGHGAVFLDQRGTMKTASIFGRAAT
ncbi:hypothetical protein D9M72_80920 [compost metagenome]